MRKAVPMRVRMKMTREPEEVRRRLSFLSESLVGRGRQVDPTR